jgi:uncharacterized protein YbjQ (UPF0145 family)
MSQGSSGLPESAQARLAEIKASGTWASALTTAEFSAIRTVGFVPVGQAYGATVVSIKNAGSYGCPTYRPGTERKQEGPGSRKPVAHTAVSGSRGANAFRPLIQALYDARRSAIDRMTAEAVALGGHGVVGVRLTVEPFAAGGLEFSALGTVVRAPGEPPLLRPFTCELSGQEFTKLLLAGWTPVAIALGISIGVRHEDKSTALEASAAATWNTEVSGHTELMNRARRDAADQLRKDVIKYRGTGIVTREMELRVEDYECQSLEGESDYMAEATIVGTVITRFGQDQAWAAPIASNLILSLDDRSAIAGFSMIAPEQR